MAADLGKPAAPDRSPASIGASQPAAGVCNPRKAAEQHGKLPSSLGKGSKEEGSIRSWTTGGISMFRTACDLESAGIPGIVQEPSPCPVPEICEQSRWSFSRIESAVAIQLNAALVLL